MQSFHIIRYMQILCTMFVMHIYIMKLLLNTFHSKLNFSKRSLVLHRLSLREVPHYFVLVNNNLITNKVTRIGFCFQPTNFTPKQIRVPSQPTVNWTTIIYLWWSTTSSKSPSCLSTNSKDQISSCVVRLDQFQIHNLQSSSMYVAFIDNHGRSLDGNYCS